MTGEFGFDGAEDGPGGPDGLPCVELEFATLRRFREEMAPYLNYDGFFARSDRPLPRGTSVEFKFIMPEDFVLAHGTAVVAWTIEPEGNPDLVPGMALRFAEVGKQSRAVIDELVDFHIATGGDPFDVGIRGSRAGEIPTDSLGGIAGPAPSIIDSLPPMPRDLPMPPDPEPPPALSSDDGALPEWLSGPSTGQDSLDFRKTPPRPAVAPRSPDKFSFPPEPLANEFDVDMIFDNGEKDTTPHRPEEGSFRQMALKPRPEEKPPRDLRLGLIVTAALALVAVVVLVWSFWLRNDGEEIVESPVVVEEVAEAGVALIEDDEVMEEPAPVSETASETPAETVARLAAETAARVADRNSGTQPEPPAEEGLPESTGGAPGDVPETSPTRVFVTESPPDTREPAAAQTRASRVVDVTATAQSGTTAVVIRGNGIFDDSSMRVLRLEDPVRLWVGVKNIETFYKPNEIAVGSPEVLQVRIGYHPEDNPPALYVVLDLAGDDVVLLDHSVRGDVIRLTVGRK